MGGNVSGDRAALPLVLRFFRLPWSTRWLLLQATLWLGVARLAVLSLPFRRLAPLLGEHMAESPTSAAPEALQRARRVSWAVRVASRHTPWDSNCLAQAIAAQAMLRRRRIACTLYLGAARGQAGALQAHAWVRCGTAIITGGPGHEGYAVVSTFAANPRG